MTNINPVAVPDDDDAMTYEPLACVTVTRAELDALRQENRGLHDRNQRQDAEIDDLRGRVAELEAENAALRAGIANIEAHGRAVSLAVVRGYNRYSNAAANNNGVTLDFDGWLAMLAGDEEERGGAADSSFARARIREALGDGEEAQP